MSHDAPECSHNVAGKFLVCRGTPGHFAGFLACEDCLTEADWKSHPGWKERHYADKATKQKKAEQLDRNLGRKREETSSEVLESDAQELAVAI